LTHGSDYLDAISRNKYERLFPSIVATSSR